MPDTSTSNYRKLHMSLGSILFSRERKPLIFESMQVPDELLQSSILIQGGTVMVHGGMQIDAKLVDCVVHSLDGNPIVLSAIGQMKNCTIKGTDILITGDFSGEILALGDVEISDTARFSGTIRTCGRALISPIASGGEQAVVEYMAEGSLSEVCEPGFLGTDFTKT